MWDDQYDSVVSYKRKLLQLPQKRNILHWNKQCSKQYLSWNWWMKYLIFLIYIFQRQKSFVNYPNTIKFALLLRSLTNFHQEQSILLLSLIIFEDLHKRRLLLYVILIHENKHRTFSLSHLTKYYSYIYEENYMYVDLNWNLCFDTRES